MVTLVGYATAYGSTRSIAERIADRLRLAGIAVDVRSLDDVPDVGRYEAVVAGSAIHSGRWLPVAEQFVLRHAGALRGRPVWLFSVSTLGDEESMFRPWLARRLRALRKEPPQLARFRESVDPREHRHFAGVLAPSHWPAFGRAVFAVMGGRYGDHRNWPAIDAWADCIAAQSRTVSTTQSR